MLDPTLFYLLELKYLFLVYSGTFRMYSKCFLCVYLLMYEYKRKLFKNEMKRNDLWLNVKGN